jgi:hypothetical protein
MDLHARSSGSDALQAAFWNWKIAQYTRMEAGEPYCPGKSEFFTMSVKANWEMRNRPMDSWGEFLECSGVAKERFRWAGARPARKPPETRRSEGFRQAFEALVLRNAKCEVRRAKCEMPTRGMGMEGIGGLDRPGKPSCKGRCKFHGIS